MSTSVALVHEALFDEDLDDGAIDDEELARLALAADPDTVVPADAVPIRFGSRVTAGLVASWYMPGPEIGSYRRPSRRRRLVVLLIISAFLAIDAYGLCSTYGLVTLA